MNEIINTFEFNRLMSSSTRLANKVMRDCEEGAELSVIWVGSDSRGMLRVSCSANPLAVYNAYKRLSTVVGFYSTRRAGFDPSQVEKDLAETLTEIRERGGL